MVPTFHCCDIWHPNTIINSPPRTPRRHFSQCTIKLGQNLTSIISSVKSQPEPTTSNMKFLAIFGFLILLSLTNSLPVQEEVQAAPTDEQPNTLASLEAAAAPTTSDSHIRHKRATCDLLSMLNVQHTVCAINCIQRKYKGGYCNSKAVCVCRK